MDKSPTKNTSVLTLNLLLTQRFVAHSATKPSQISPVVTGLTDRAAGESFRANSSNMKVCRVRWPQWFFGFPPNQIKIANNGCGLHAPQPLALALSAGADWILGGLSWIAAPHQAHSAPVSIASGVLWPKIWGTLALSTNPCLLCAPTWQFSKEIQNFHLIYISKSYKCSNCQSFVFNPVSLSWSSSSHKNLFLSGITLIC